MKKAGIIITVFGVLAFLGAMLKDHSVFGPVFWIALGAFLIYRAGIKEEKKYKEEQQAKAAATRQRNPKEVIDTATAENHDNDDIPSQDSTRDNQPETLAELQSQLTIRQREAAMCLISFFAGYHSNPSDDSVILLLKQSATFFGFPDTPLALSKILKKYPDADALIDIVITIKPVKAKEYLLLTCYDLIKSSKNSEALHILTCIAQDMGYEKTKFLNLINLYL